MTGASSIALSGMRDAQLRVDVAAHNIANMNTDGFVPSRVISSEARGGGVQSTVQPGTPPPLPPGRPPLPSGTDLPTELMGMMTAELAYVANAMVLRTQAEMTGTLLDVLDDRDGRRHHR
jgi:flagellar basal-body rod protein FlgC